VLAVSFENGSTSNEDELFVDEGGKVGSHIGAVIDEGRLDAKEIVKRWSQSFTL
jgi:hypothetical protein